MGPHDAKRMDHERQKSPKIPWLIISPFATLFEFHLREANDILKGVSISPFCEKKVSLNPMAIISPSYRKFEMIQFSKFQIYIARSEACVIEVKKFKFIHQ